MGDDRAPSARTLKRIAEQRSRRRARRKVVWALVGAVAIVGASVVGSVLWYTSPEDVGPMETVPVISGGGESVLVLLTSGEEVVSFGLAVSHPGLPDRVLLFPPGLLTVLPGYGSWELARADEFGGPGLPAITLTNLTGARIDGTVRLPVEAVGRALDGVEMELASPVIGVQGDDQVVLVAAGTAVRDASRIALIVGEQGTDDQLTWLVRQGMVLDRLLEAISARAGLIDDLMSSASGDLTLARDVLAAVAADPETRVTAAQVKPIASLGGSDERYQLPVEQAEDFLGQHAPFLALTDGDRPRVEVLNGTGRVAITPPIAAELVEAGFRIVLTDNADRDDYAITRIVGHTEANQDAALAAHEVLGFGEVRLEVRQPSGIVDITVIVGDDFS